MTENRLLQLQELGQSPWCDNIGRSFIKEKLAGWIKAGEITGATSNPTIFEKSIAGRRDYDAEFEALVRAGKSAAEIAEALMVADIQAVADLLRPVYERTQRRDGYISLEVPPALANQTEASYREAKRLFELIGRPNAMIKIPGTPEGLPAIERAIAGGVNINITLLFSIENYEQVAQAYLSALEQRVAAGQPIDHLASVASFFVSRVDTAVDAQLEQRIGAGETELSDLLGKAAIANAKLAYQSFKQIFAGPRWKALEAKGARLQRPLWGSTSTKNPRYSDVMYVDELIGPHTVNTMPPATIEAFHDHGKLALTLEQDLDGARDTFRRLAEVGIDLDAVTHKLQEDGVAAFAKSFDDLMEATERKRAAVLAGTSGAAVR